MINRYDIIGNTVIIYLDSKKYGVIGTTISKADFDKVNSFSGKWYLWHRDSNGYYVKGNIIKEDGKRSTIFLHRFIMDIEDSKVVVDHIDFNGLNNTRENLRSVTNTENSQNRNGAYASNVSSGARGVSLNKKIGRYESYINISYKKYRIGYYDSLAEASEMSSIARAILMPYSNIDSIRYGHYVENPSSPMLYFRYGTMGSGKSESIINLCHIYGMIGKKVLVMSSSVDSRNGGNKVWSRNGKEIDSVPICNTDNLFEIVRNTCPDAVIVDEIQFASKNTIMQLCEIVDTLGINVFAYGLKNDFMNNLFDGSMYMMLYADIVQGIYGNCSYCDKKATMVLRTEDGIPVSEGEQIVVDNEENRGKNIAYHPVCRKCYSSQLIPF